MIRPGPGLCFTSARMDGYLNTDALRAARSIVHPLFTPVG
jgi:hypothetical protein